MAYPQNAVPVTAHAVFYSHSIWVNGIEIGSFERFSPASQRTTERIREVLFSRGPEVKEIVWAGTDHTIALSRVEMYHKAMMEAFGFAIFSIEDLNQPVNIVEIQHMPTGALRPDLMGYAGGGTKTISYEGAVASRWGKDIDTGTARIVESMDFDVRVIRGFYE